MTAKKLFRLYPKGLTLKQFYEVTEGMEIGHINKLVQDAVILARTPEYKLRHGFILANTGTTGRKSVFNSML